MKTKVSAIQMNCILGKVDHNLEKAKALAEQAVGEGAQWVVFPELFNTGYQPENDWEFAEEIPSGKTTQWMVSLANEYDILVMGCIVERAGIDGIIYDTFVTVSKEGLLGRYRKIHLWGNEALRFTTGNEYAPPVQWGDWKIGMQICYDLGFPEGGRLLTLRGANVLVYSAAFGAARIYAWDLATRARALENGCYVICAGRSGTEKDLTFAARSRVIGPDGTVLSEATREYEVVYAELDLDTVVSQRKAVPYLRDVNIPFHKEAWRRL